MYRAVDRDGHIVDFLLRDKRVHAAARAFFGCAIVRHGAPEKITIDKSGTNTAAIMSRQADSGLPIEMRQSKYLNNLVEQEGQLGEVKHPGSFAVNPFYSLAF